MPTFRRDRRYLGRVVCLARLVKPAASLIRTSCNCPLKSSSSSISCGACRRRPAGCGTAPTGPLSSTIAFQVKSSKPKAASVRSCFVVIRCSNCRQTCRDGFLSHHLLRMTERPMPARARLAKSCGCMAFAGVCDPVTVGAKNFQYPVKVSSRCKSE